MPLSQDMIAQILNAVNEFKGVKMELTQMNQKLTKLDMLEEVSKKVTELQASIEFAHGEIEDIKKENVELKKQVKDMCRKVDQLTDEKGRVTAKIIDLQARSMRDNLLFFGIHEEEEKEDCEQLLKAALYHHLKINAQEIQFARVHRIGRKIRGKTRPIVAKFERFKERQMVRDAFFDHLNKVKKRNEESGKQEKVQIGIAEQFPAEVQQKRKSLIPKMKEAKNEGKKVKLVRDQLYINGQLFKENQDANDMDTN